jgi:hypothetical protein
LNSIEIAGGIALLINESNVDNLTDMIEERVNGTA